MLKPEYNIKASQIVRGISCNPCMSFRLPLSCQFQVQCFSGSRCPHSNWVSANSETCSLHLAPGAILHLEIVSWWRYEKLNSNPRQLGLIIFLLTQQLFYPSNIPTWIITSHVVSPLPLQLNTRLSQLAFWALSQVSYVPLHSCYTTTRIAWSPS